MLTFFSQLKCKIDVIDPVMGFKFGLIWFDLFIRWWAFIITILKNSHAFAHITEPRRSWALTLSYSKQLMFVQRYFSELHLPNQLFLQADHFEIH